MNNNRIIYLVVLLVLVIIAAVYYFKVVDNDKNQSTTNTNGNKASQIVKTQVETDKLPEKFPADVPIEKDAKILQNYNATAPDGRFQATRVFETKESLAANITLYRNFLTKAGYEIKSSVDQPNYKMLYATKGDAGLQIAVDQNTVSKVRTVSISYTELPVVPAAANTNTTANSNSTAQ